MSRLGPSGGGCPTVARVSILITYFVELPCVVVAVVDADLSPEDANVHSDSEVVRHEWALGAVLLQNHLPLEEGALRGARVFDFGLSQHDGLVLKVVEDGYFSDSVILKSALNNTFLEVAVESQHL